MRRLLWAGSIVSATAAVVAGAVVAAALATRSVATHDTEDLLWPDVRERQSAHLQLLSGRIRGYAGTHRGALPSDLIALTRLFPSDEHGAVSRLVVDLWGTPIVYEPIGAVFTVRSAGPDRAWHTADDLAETAGTTFDARPRRSGYDSRLRSADSLRAGARKASPTVPPT
jgi:hypothetical protein